MAFWNRKDIEKAAPPLPAGATTTQFSPEQLAGIASQMYSVGNYIPLPRQAGMNAIPFGPSNPLSPSAINPVNEDGKTEPRRWEYPVAWNIFVTEQRFVPWKVLRVAADQIDLLRRCVEVTKNKIAGLDWDITFSEAASEMIASNSTDNHVRAMQKARDEFTGEISRVREFWQTPDRLNGMSFKDWATMLLEEVLVLDALAIYPHPDMKGDLHSLEILDGSTIKPLLDDRGMRPRAPYPAYQQMLYGFPRGEFTAASDDPSLDGSFNADELIYKIRNPRTWTPYGYSPVERALPLADIYLKRQQWLRAEFTDGVTPNLMFKSDPNFGGTPELLRAWENILNDDLSGQTEQRHRARIIPSGLDPIDFSGASEKFNASFDEYLIKGICGHFGVMPTEIGYADGGTLGGAGQQQGEAESASLIGANPLTRWLEDQISDISYKFLGMPRELVFRFDGGRSQETEASAKMRDMELKSGQRTINEARADLGLPLLDAPEADVPMLHAGSNLYFITPEGIAAPSTGMMPETPTTQPMGESGEELPERDAEDAVDAEVDERQEIKAFLKWAKKGNTDREFEFLAVDSIHAAALNRAIQDDDFELAKSISEVYLKKA